MHEGFLAFSQCGVYIKKSFFMGVPLLPFAFPSTGRGAGPRSKGSGLHRLLICPLSGLSGLSPHVSELGPFGSSASAAGHLPPPDGSRQGPARATRTKAPVRSPDVRRARPHSEGGPRKATFTANR